MAPVPSILAPLVPGSTAAVATDDHGLLDVTVLSRMHIMRLLSRNAEANDSRSDEQPIRNHSGPGIDVSMLIQHDAAREADRGQ